MTRLDRPAGAQWSTLARRPGRNPFTSFTAEPVPLPRTEWLSSRSRGSKPRPNVGHPRNGTKRRDTIPAAIRASVGLRDEWCVRCGDPDGLHCHHRRLKGQGGDTREHTECSCNICRLCARCHLEVHTGDRDEAEAEGYIVPAETLLPGSVSVLVRSEDGGMAKYPSCDGRWLDESEAAA